MPALAPVAKVVRVRWTGTDANDDAVGTHVDIAYSGSAPSTAELNTFCTAVGTAWNTYLASVTPDDFTLTAVEAEDLTSPTASIGAAVVSHAGTATGTPPPLGTAFTLQYQVNLRRRGGHFHGQHRFGVMSDLQTAQTWTTGFVASVLTQWGEFIAAVLADTWSGAGALTHVGIGYYGPPNRTITGSTGRVRTVSTALAFPVVYPVIGYAANTRLGSQRKRLGKSGT